MPSHNVQILMSTSSVTRYVASLFVAALFGGAACMLPSVARAADNDVTRTVVKVDFVTTGADAVLSPADAAAVPLTSSPDQLPDGAKRAMIGDSHASFDEWNEFFHSRANLFDAGEAYKVAFDYRVLAKHDDTGFYMLLRRAGDANNKQGWQDLQGAVGVSGHVQTSFATREFGDYMLVIGIHNRGTISVSNITITTDPVHRIPIISLPSPSYTWTAKPKTTYYADSVGGNDSNDGTKPGRAWKTLDKINTGSFAPGDQILLKRGSSWLGYLAPGGSGTAAAPIVLGAYGAAADPKPKIDAQGKWLATLLLLNTEYWTAQDIDVANKGTVPQPHLAGVEAKLTNFGTAHQIKLIDLDVHDVTGSDEKSAGGGEGIDCEASGESAPSRYDGLLIQGCHITRTDRNGIIMGGNWSRDHWFPHLHVVISQNELDSIGGDGIVPLACDGDVVDHNVIRGAHMRCTDYAAGIWPWACDNSVIEYNDVSGMRGRTDGEAYDSDYNCRNTLFQYNYSHDNDGGFVLMCNDGSQHMPWNIGNDGTVFRYNVSVGDRYRWFTLSGPITNTKIYNNTVVTLPSDTVMPIDAGNWGGAYATGIVFSNNIFDCPTIAKFDLKGITNATFDHNDYFGQIANQPADPAALTVAPGFAAGSKLPATADDCKLSANSPLKAAGTPIPDNGGQTFAGDPVGQGNPNIGAF